MYLDQLPPKHAKMVKVVAVHFNNLCNTQTPTQAMETIRKELVKNG